MFYGGVGGGYGGDGGGLWDVVEVEVVVIWSVIVLGVVDMVFVGVAMDEVVDDVLVFTDTVMVITAVAVVLVRGICVEVWA